MSNEQAVRAALEAARGRCLTCDRDACQVMPLSRERDRVWGEFDAAKYRGEYSESLKMEAFAASAKCTDAENDCRKHAVNWRGRALAAEAVILATLPPALTEMEVDEVATARVREWAHHDPDRRNLLAIIDRLTGGAK